MTAMVAFASDVLKMRRLTMSKQDMLGPVMRKLVKLPLGWLGVLNDLLEKITGENKHKWMRALKRVLREEDVFSGFWTFQLKTKACFGVHLAGAYEGKGGRLDRLVGDWLNLRFAERGEKKTHRLVVIPASQFEEGSRTEEIIRAEAKRRGYLTPSAEIVPYLAMKFSEGDFEHEGLKALVVMHKPIQSIGYPSFLVVSKGTPGKMHFFEAESGFQWEEGFGFVFLLPEAASTA